MTLLVEESDSEKVRRMFAEDWIRDLEREGLEPMQAHGDLSSGDPPCPACGFVGPLIAGACGDCGLMLG